MCEREKSLTFGKYTHFLIIFPFHFRVRVYAKLDGRGWGRLNLNGGLDHSLKEMKDEKKRNEMVHF